MSTLLVSKEILVWKKHLQKIYAGYSKYIMRALRFVLGLLIFGVINHNLGFMKGVSSFVFSLGLSAICAFLPVGMTTFAASLLILIHLYALSLPIAVVVLMILLLMYIFYFRFTPEKSILLLVTPVAFVFKVPFVIPVAFGLLSTPVAAVPAVLGTVTYYMLHFIKMSSSAYKGESAKDMAAELSSFIRQIFTNKEMWVMAAAVCISLLIVYIIRTKSVAHCWKIASVSGAVSAMIISAAGNIKFDLDMSFLSILLRGAAAVAAGLVLELIFFAVNYSATEHLQFEDNEYYYYVKAIPKLVVSTPQLSVKHINKRKEDPGKQEAPPAAQKAKENVKEKISAQETTVVDTRKVRHAADDVKNYFTNRRKPAPYRQVRKVADIRPEDKALLKKKILEESYQDVGLRPESHDGQKKFSL